MSETSHRKRIDRVGEFNTALNKNRKRVLMAENYCAICGQYVDKTLDQYDPMSAQVDHIIPIAKGGHPSDIGNLQLTHRVCNLRKSDKLFVEQKSATESNNKIDVLRWSQNWVDYRAE